MSEGTSIAAEGEPVTLNTGHPVRFRYSMLSVLWIEEHYGSIEAINPLGQQMLYTQTTDFMVAGLLHEHDGTEEKAPLTRERLAELYDPPQHEAMMTASNAAWRQAFPPEPADKPAKTRKGRSPGQSGTTAPPLSSVEPIASSG